MIKKFNNFRITENDEYDDESDFRRMQMRVDDSSDSGSNTKKKVYLAGGWSGWRDIIIEEFKDKNIEWLDPRTATKKSNWFEMEVEMVRKADLVVGWITSDNKSGFGMTYELGMSYALNKPYIFINEQELGAYKWDMQRSGAVESFSNHKDAFEWIRKNNWL